MLKDIYKKSLADNPEKAAFICGDRSFSYRQLDEGVDIYTRTLSGLGVQAGDRVGIYMPNCPEIIYTFFACFRLGAVAVPTSYFTQPSEAVYEANHCGIKYYLVSHEKFDVVKDLPLEVPSLEDIYIVNSKDQKEGLDWLNALNNAPDSVELPQVEENAPALVLYTSGSTSKPKGVIHTHSSLYHSALNRSGTLQHDKNDVFLTSSFLCHGAAPSIVLFPMLLSGGTAVFMTNHGVEAFLNTLEKYRATFAVGSPLQWRDVLDLPICADTDFSSLRYASAGGDTVPVDLQKRFTEITGVELVASMGMTELGGYLTIPPGEKNKPGTIGKPIAGTEVRIVDEEGNDVDSSGIGEMIVRTKSMAAGYWNDPDNTANTIVDGWFHTGDLARVDEDGYFYFAGRCKNIIICGGGNVAPGEVEEVLNSYPEVKASTVVGVPDDEAGHVVYAFIVPQNKAKPPRIEQLKVYAAEKLSERKVPVYWKLIDELPENTATKKVDTKLLKKMAEQSLNP